MPVLTTKVGGLDALHRALSEFPERVAKNKLRAACNAGAAVFRDEARLKAPVWTGPVSQGHPPPGTLQRAIIVKQIPEQSSYYRQVYYVTVRHGKKYQKQGKKGNLSQDAFYWTWVEFGHYYASHGTKGSPSSAFVPAHPFMRPAYVSKREAALSVFTDKLSAGIEEVRQELKR